MKCHHDHSVHSFSYCNSRADLLLLYSFESIAKWKAEIDSKVLLPNGSPLPVILLGNKCDLDVNV